MNKDIRMCGIGSYRVEIDKKQDVDYDLSKFEFFWSMRLPSSRPDSIALVCIGGSLTDIVSKIESVIKDYAYISSVTCLPGVVEIYNCESYE